jgi:hypothetical protein
MAGNANGRGARCAGSRPLRHYRDRRRAAPELQPIIVSSVLAGERTLAEFVIQPSSWYEKHGIHLIAGKRERGQAQRRQRDQQTDRRVVEVEAGQECWTCLDTTWLLARCRVQSDGEWCLPASPISITNSIGAIDPRKPKLRDTVRRPAAFYQIDVRRSVSIPIGHAPRADRYDCCVQSPRDPKARHLRSKCRPASRIAGAPIATAKEHADEQTEPKLDFGLEPRE